MDPTNPLRARREILIMSRQAAGVDIDQEIKTYKIREVVRFDFYGICQDFGIEDTDLVAYEFAFSSAPDDVIGGWQVHRNCLILFGYAGEKPRLYNLKKPNEVYPVEFDFFKKRSRRMYNALRRGTFKRIIRWYFWNPRADFDDYVRLTNGPCIYEVSQEAYDGYRARRSVTAGAPYEVAFQQRLKYFSRTRRVMPFVPFTARTGILYQNFGIYEPILASAGIEPVVAVTASATGYIPQTKEDLIKYAIVQLFSKFRGKISRYFEFKDPVMQARFLALAYKIKSSVTREDFLEDLTWAEQLVITEE